MRIENEILYVGDRKKTIFFYEEDVSLLKSLSAHILEQYESFDIFGTDNLKDLNHELLHSRPSLIILSITDQNYQGVSDFICKIRLDSVLMETPIMTLGSRELIEEKSEELGKWAISFVPKAIRVPFFMGVLSANISKAESVGINTVIIKKGDHLFNENDPSDHLYIVKSGLLKIYKKKAGQVFNMATVGRFEIIGEMGIIDEAKRSASVVALEDSEVYVLNLGNLENYFSAQPFWLKMILKSVITRLRETSDKVLS